MAHRKGWRVGAGLGEKHQMWWSKAEPLWEAGSSSPMFLAGSKHFGLLGPEFQLYWQPVILFKQPLLFE